METLEQLKEILDGAIDGDLFHDGRYLNEKLHVRGLIDKYSVSGIKSHVVYDAPLYVNTGKLRSLSDIKLIIELMELNQNMHTTVAGYLWGKDWAHWNEFNAGKFKL